MTQNFGLFDIGLFSLAKGAGREENSIDLEEDEEMMREVSTAGLEDSALQEAGFRTEEVPHYWGYLH
jgi:hypothetical protein